jgi:TPP-dependent pyruvate/acetoin dehydrogenase alpha subunit
MVKEIELKSEIKPGKINFSAISVFHYNRTLQQEVDEGYTNRKVCLEMLEQMLMIRTLEEMLVEIIGGTYKPLPSFKYVGLTHLSIG